MNKLTIGFIGLGNMGGHMSANLAQAGFQVYGYDINPDAVKRAAERGVIASESLEHVAKASDVIFTMLPSGEYVRDVWGQLVTLLKQGITLVDSSTVDVATAKSLHALAAEHGFKSVDAPVSGGVNGAKNAALTFMVGGEPDAITVVEPLLAHLGKKTVICGGAGAGQSAKICNNMILGVSIIAVSEAFAMAEKLGLSAEALFDVASTSTGQCWALTSYCPVPGLVPGAPSNNNYQPGAPATMLLKDLLLAQGAARDSDSATPLATHATDIFEQFVKDGHGHQDFSAIIQSLRAKTVE